MIGKSPRGLFITGTDTGAGKTHVAAAIARDLHRRGYRVGVYKPAASGCRVLAGSGGRLISDDALALWEAAGRPTAGMASSQDALDAVCPQRFATPLAPHLAARAEGREVDSALLRSGVGVWLSTSDIVLVEGAGGWLSPLGEHDYVADVAAELGYPIVVVAANALGVINQTLQTLLAIGTYRGGQPVAGVVLNRMQPPDESDPSVFMNRAELERRCAEFHAPARVLGEIAFGADGLDRDVDWFAIAHPPAT